MWKSKHKTLLIGSILIGALLVSYKAVDIYDHKNGTCFAKKPHYSDQELVDIIVNEHLKSTAGPSYKSYKNTPFGLPGGISSKEQLYSMYPGCCSLLERNNINKHNYPVHVELDFGGPVVGAQTSRCGTGGFRSYAYKD